MQTATIPRNHDLLQTLIEGAARLAQLVLAQAEQAAQRATAAQPGTHPQNALTLDQATIAYDRITRTARRAIALQAHLSKPPQPAQPQPPRQNLVEARTRIIRTVEDAIHNAQHHDHAFNAGERDDFADCRAELYTRIDRPEFDHELAARPVDDIITEITRDLRVWFAHGTYRPQRRTLEDLENLAARAARTPLPHPQRAIAQLGPDLEPDLDPQSTSLATQMIDDLESVPNDRFEPALRAICHQMEAEGQRRK